MKGFKFMLTDFAVKNVPSLDTTYRVTLPTQIYVDMLSETEFIGPPMITVLK